MLLEEATKSGVMTICRNVGQNITEVFQNRFELMAVELKEEKKRSISMLIFGGATIFFGFMALAALTATVIFALWESALPVAIGVAVFYLVAILVCVFALKGRLKKKPFAESIRQFKKDRKWLGK
jgi:uncharacterized membrane protein YqjE